ncbi:cysteine-rich KTR domain-containing protein [Acutalibacter sp. M00204]|uniref:cysteine-rich KTR domain-containing protein n=1 Tax=Acutalibacter intestini TaxID=3093659 RepID=UPI002AC941A2|nr:cysteine-rich KTR domain-containing protein [Acutalibacter sp. M00204]
MYVNRKKTEWVRCPACGSKTRNRIREDTILKNYPLYCPKCRQENRCPQNDVGQAETFPYTAVGRRTEAHTTAFL